MSEQDLLAGIIAREVSTWRLKTHLLESGSEDGVPALFIHGNVATSRFFEETLVVLPSGYRGLAPDLRGFGESETKPVDATQGLRDFSDDLHALATALGYGTEQKKIHLVGWSLGGGIAMRYVIDHPAEVASLTLISSMPPYGMGGTKDTAGTPCWPDYAGSGGGMAAPQFVERLEKDDRTAESPFSPRTVMNSVYFNPPFRAKREEVFVSEMLKTEVGDYNYPGDRSSSPNWPRVAPGTWGVLNAISPLYCNLNVFAKINPKPPVLWIRGSKDRLVSNDSMDSGRRGRLGLIRDWPGEEIFPPQPMVSQLYNVLDIYKRDGGWYEDVVLDCGHSPHIEMPEAFRQEFFGFLDKVKRAKESSGTVRTEDREGIVAPEPTPPRTPPPDP